MTYLGFANADDSKFRCTDCKELTWDCSCHRKTGRCCQYPHWGDTNVTLLLLGGGKLDVKCPDRIGVEYNSIGSRCGRQWNTAAVDVLDNYNRHLYPQDACIVVGKWGTEYGNPDYKVRLPITNVIGVAALVVAKD